MIDKYLIPVGSREFVPVSDEVIKELEKLGTISGDYQKFIRTFGYCCPVRDLNMVYSCYVTPSAELRKDLSWMTKETSGEDQLATFYGMPTSNLSGVIQWKNYYEGRIPKTLLPIADTRLGNQVCLGIAGDEIGKIFLWELESEIEVEDFITDGEPPREVLFWNVYTLYESFSDLVLDLKS